MSHFLLLTVLSFGILAGPKATTDGYVYLGHNEDIPGDKMLNIYNVPAAPDRLAGLWFEFPGQIGDSYINEYGVCLVSNHTPSREDKVRGKFDYEIQTKVFNQARSAREAVEIIGAMVGRHGYKGNGRSYLIADSKGGWVCSVVGGKRWVAQRVPDDEIMVIRDCFNIREVDLADTENFLGSKDLIRYAKRRGWYSPSRDGVFDFAKAYSAASSSVEGSFSNKPEKKIHRRDVSKLLTEPSTRTDETALTTVFTMNPAYPPERGTVIWVGFPNQDTAGQSQWTIFTKVPDSCHRYSDPDMALARHFSDTKDFRERWPEHFYWHYLYPETNIDVVPHDFLVYVPKQPRDESKRDLSKTGDTFNDHFHVLEDNMRGLLHAFWTQGSFEAAHDEHVVHASSADGGKTWTDPVLIAGSATLADPKPVAAWQQPMISRSGRLYCLWNQETTVKKHLCGIMCGRYSDDGGNTWSDPEIVPFPKRFAADPEDPSIPPTWCMWQRPLRLGKDGRYLAGCSRYGTDGKSRVEFWRYENIDEDPEIKDIQISFFNTDGDSFDASKVVRDEDYLPREGLNVEEACITGLPDGRLFAVMRTSIGHPIWSVSSDDGETWSRPEVLRKKDGGEAILQPCSPCPIYDYKGPEARSGKYFLLVHNTFDFNGLTSYQNRGPLYKLDGEYVEGAHQPIWFTDKGIFSPRDTGNSFYTSYTAQNGRGVLWFGDQKFYLFGRILEK